jgi:site-specific recombinase XerD
VQIKASDFLDYIKESKSKGTFKEYKSGLAKFVEWYGKSLDEILAERKQDLASEDATQRKRFVREIEKFHKWLLTPQQDRDKYSINSARTSTLGILQFFRFFEMPITIEKGSSVSQTVETTSDFVPTIQQYRDMFNVGDLRGRTILSMALDLGWRISDFLEIKKLDIPDLTQETPIAFDRITEKEKVIAKSFLSAETVELLKTFMPTLKAENPYLFQSNSHNHLDPESVGDILKSLAKKANIKIPQGKRLRFHAFRKRFLSTCADLKIDVNTAKLLVGKDIESSMLTYLSEVNHKKAFLEIKSVLNLINGRMKSTVDAKDAEIEKLKKQNEDLQRQMNILAMMLKKELLEEAQKQGVVIGKKSGLEPTPTEILKELAKIKEQQDREEYEKLLAEKNGNGNNGA